MARPRTVSDDAILSAARSVFLDLGPSASTSIIADRVGLSQAGLFKRFATKADLMVAALAPPAVPPFTEALEGGPDADRPIQPQLREIARGIALFFTEMVPCLMVLSASGILPQQLLTRFDVPPPLVAKVALVGWIQRAMDEGRIRRGDADPLVSALMGALHMRSFLCHISDNPMSGPDLDAYADSVVDNLWNGLAPTQESP
jgi:AcrR family transcriptional regulator